MIICDLEKNDNPPSKGVTSTKVMNTEIGEAHLFKESESNDEKNILYFRWINLFKERVGDIAERTKYLEFRPKK